MTAAGASLDPFDRFDRIYCINLDRRPDRWARVQAELARVGLLARVERVPGVVDADGAVGCRDSHRECIRRAHAAGAEMVLVLEDDVVFVDEPRAPLRDALAELDEDPAWDALYLGGQCTALPASRGRHLYRGRMVQAHAIVLHRRAFGRALHATVPVDIWYELTLRAYGIYPPIAFQASDFSDISPGLQDRRSALHRSQQIFLETSALGALWRWAWFSLRRGAGLQLVKAARRAGIPLRFEGGRPRLGAP